MAEGGEQKSKFSGLAASVLGIAALIGAFATLIGNVASLRDAWCNNIGTFCPVKKSLKKDSSALENTTKESLNVDIFNNILRASYDEPINFSSVRMDSPFLAGFLKPIDLQTLDYFIRLGYSRELLFWLFVDTFRLTLNGRQYVYHYGPPDDYGCSSADPKHRCFIDWVRNATFTGLTVEEKTALGSSGGHSITITYARFCFDTVLGQQAQASVGAALGQASPKDLETSLSNPNSSPLSCGSGSWDPTTTASVPQPDIPPLVLGPIALSLVPRSATGIFGFLGNLLKMEREHIVPAPYAYISSGREYAAEPPRLVTVHDDPLLMTVLQNLGGECFVHTRINNADYCVPPQAATTKRVFGILAHLIGIQTTPDNASQR